ncbi:hypothetical protein LCGC14_2814830, partial [marine sediment metagenome]
MLSSCMPRLSMSIDPESEAEELAFAELGPKPEHEVQRALDRDLTAELVSTMQRSRLTPVGGP